MTGTITIHTAGRIQTVTIITTAIAITTGDTRIVTTLGRRRGTIVTDIGLIHTGTMWTATGITTGAAGGRTVIARTEPIIGARSQSVRGME